MKLFDWLPDSREIICVWRLVTNKKLYQDGHQSHAIIACHWRPVTLKMYPSGSQWYVTCTRVAASCSKITVNFILFIQLVATPAQFACGWWPFRYNLNVTGHWSHAIFACISRQFSEEMPVFESTQPEQLFELKMRKPLKNLRAYTIYVLARTYPSILCTARSNFVRQFL